MQTRLDRDAVHTFVLLSDGAAAGVDEYKQPTDGTAAHKTLASTGPAGFIEDVRRTEETDANGQRWPRAKRHDDKTMVLAQFHG